MPEETWNSHSLVHWFQALKLIKYVGILFFRICTKILSSSFVTVHIVVNLTKSSNNLIIYNVEFYKDNANGENYTNFQISVRNIHFNGF